MDTTSTGELTSRISIVPASSAVAPPQTVGAPRLVVLIGNEPGRRYSLESNDAVVIGRGDDCDVRLDDTKVSRQHARVSRVPEGAWAIEDLGSRNGTLLNGDPVVHRTPLMLGDRIQISQDTLLLFTRQDPLEDLLLHRQQMEVIGQLAAGIAHDFNNLLNVIAASTAHLATLEKSTPLDDREVLECHDDIRAASQRAAELTARLLTIARRRERRLDVRAIEQVDLSKLCEDVLHLVRRTFDRSINITSRIEPGLALEGDQPALHQLLMNLLLNARDAMPKGGTLTLIARLELSPPPSPTTPWRSGPQILIDVIDTGIGMDEKTRARVFEPFFTTKEQGAGSGLGLATVYEVATSHGGFVEVESAPGKGATFRVRLPAHLTERVEPNRTRKRRATTWDRSGGRPTRGLILVVDDQELVRRSLGRLVRAAGHEVLFASDGHEALDVYFGSERRPDVVLLDLDMPNLSGTETLDRLRETDPDVRVLVVSGYHDESRKRRLLAAGAADFLGKPVNARELAESLRLALQLSSVGF